jgi:signal peptidase I
MPLVDAVVDGIPNALVDGAVLTAQSPEPKKMNSFLELLQFAFIALLIVVPVRYFIAQPFIVSGASMEQTFHTGEYLIIDQVSYYFEDPVRGDVVVFRYPKDPSKFFIKRIIGLPGESINIQGNIVTITSTDGVKTVLSEPYIKTMAQNTSLTEILGEREYFVMGDNRDASSDSRMWGVLNKDKIVGRAFLRLFPFNKAEIMPGEHTYIISNT